LKFTKRDAKAIYKRTLERLEELRVEYKGTEVPDRIILKAEKVLAAASAADALELGEKAYQSMFVNLLYLWGQGKIEGKPSAVEIEKKARGAENLANMLESKGLEKQAEKQRLRAEKLRSGKLTPAPKPDKVNTTMKLKPGMQVMIETKGGRETVTVVSARGRGLKVTRKVGTRSFSIPRTDVVGVPNG